MSDYKEKLEPLCELECVIVTALEEEISKGIENIDTSEIGEVVDIVKDLAQAQKYICEAAYYKEVIDAMNSKTNDFGKAVESIKHVWVKSDDIHKDEIKNGITDLLSGMM